MLKVVDRWTTRDGHWYNSGQEYDIDQAHISKYPASTIPQAGAATHIVVRVPAGSTVEFINRYDGKVYKTANAFPDGKWVDFEMYHSSGYVPERGETGPWTVKVDGQVVAEGIGLPESWHVSTWLVVEYVDGGEEPGTGEGPEIPPTEPRNKTITLLTMTIHYSDGTTKSVEFP